MSEHKWIAKYRNCSFRGRHGKKGGSQFPRHQMNSFEGTHLGMRQRYKREWHNRGGAALHFKYVIGLLNKFVGKSYYDFKQEYDNRLKNLKKYNLEWCRLEDYLYYEEVKDSYCWKQKFYVDENDIIRKCKILSHHNHTYPHLNKSQKHFNKRVKLPEWGQVRIDSRFDVNNDPSYINSYMPDKFREPLLLGTFYVVVNEKVCKLPIYTCNKEIFKTYSTYRDEKWDSEKRRYIKTPFWKSDAWNCKLINPAKRKKIAEQWIPVDVYTLPKLKHDFWCEAKHRDRYNLEERIENLNNKINTALDFNIRLELIGDRNKLIHQLDELPQTAYYNLGYGRYYPFVKISDYENFVNKND